MDETLRSELQALVRETVREYLTNLPVWKLQRVFTEETRKARLQACGRIKVWREAQGLTQRQIADRIGVSGHLVERWENERNTPSANMLNRLKSEFGIDFMAELPAEPKKSEEGGPSHE